MKLNRPDSTLPFPKLHRYGWITKAESELVEKLLGKIKAEFGQIRFLEIGVFGGCTMLGITEWAENNDCPCYCEGVDIGHKPNFVPEGYVYHQGDSALISKDVKGPFNLLWIDACHCCFCATSDFMNYSPLLEEGGYCLFHDTAGHGTENIQGEFKQDHSHRHEPSQVLGVRQALRNLGLDGGTRPGWILVDEIKESEIMGMMVFKKTQQV